MRGPVWAREKHPRKKVRERPLDVIVRVIIGGQNMSPVGDDSEDIRLMDKAARGVDVLCDACRRGEVHVASGETIICSILCQ